MVDIHAHILSGVDHGSSNIEESLKMLSDMESEGVTDVFCTSHYYASKETPEDFSARYDLGFKELERVNTTSVKLHRGAEVSISRYFHYKEPHESLFLGNTRRILIELPFGDVLEDWVLDAVASLRDSYNVIPVIAHAEQYRYFEAKPQKLLDFIALDAEIQVDAESFSMRSAKKVLKFLIKNGLIQYLASDVHYGMERKSMKEGLENLLKKAGSDAVNAVIQNARALVSAKKQVK